MTITSQDQFEQAYSEDNGGMPVAFITLQRLGDSYSVPKIARAWYWWKRSRSAVVVELPIRYSVDEGGGFHESAHGDCFDVRQIEHALETAGVAVAP